ncbi:MAG: flagellar basal body P-ring formation protein FlgA [Methylococcaceae bacterium]|nr:flagellar basal body P-ring formation protein FlgA [Methylococcaceae bacterium]
MQLLSIFLLGLCTLTQSTFAGEFQTPESIYTAARLLIDKTLEPTTEHETTFSPLDPRLQLSVCEQPLEAFSATQTIKPGRNAISVKCNSMKSWSLYVSAQVKVYQDVVTLTRPVKRGEILTEDMLSIKRVDISQFSTPLIHDLNVAAHKQAAHNLSQGAILNERDITQAILIKRGENVTISSSNPSLSIQMQGIAQMDGVQGQTIRVKNTSSDKIISGVVTKQGTVAINR